MENNTAGLDGKVALVSGGAQRLGAAIGRTLHGAGMNLAIHYRRSSGAAETLRDDLERKRPGSVALLQADLLDMAATRTMVDRVVEIWGRLDTLVNNASVFEPTPVGQVDETTWDRLLDTNLKAPFFLCQAASPVLRTNRGCIVNLVDIYGQRPLPEHAVYCASKAGLVMLTRALARDLGPEVRCNAVAPGAILWPEGGLDAGAREAILARTALKRTGTPADIARAVLFLVQDAEYVTGEVIAVDGGRSLNQ